VDPIPPKTKPRRKKSFKKKTNTELLTKKKENEDIQYKNAKYEKTTKRDLDHLRDTKWGTNRNRLYQKYIDEYKGFFNFYTQTMQYIPSDRFDKIFGSGEFNSFWNQLSILSKGYKSRKRMKGESDEEFKTIKILMFSSMFFKGFEGLIDELPMELRNALAREMKPKLKLIESLADYAKSVNPNLKGMDLLRTNLTHDELPVY